MSKLGDAFKRFGAKFEESFNSGKLYTTLGITALSFGLVSGYPALRDDFTGDKGEAAIQKCFVDKSACTQEEYLEGYKIQQSEQGLSGLAFASIGLFGMGGLQRKLNNEQNKKPKSGPSAP